MAIANNEIQIQWASVNRVFAEGMAADEGKGKRKL